MHGRPSASRPPPPIVLPIEHKGVLYEQEMNGLQNGLERASGYLVAINPKTNERLWVLQIYATFDDPRMEGDAHVRYFRKMKLIDGRDALQIEDEHGCRYEGDLISRTVSNCNSQADF